MALHKSYDYHHKRSINLDINMWMYLWKFMSLFLFHRSLLPNESYVVKLEILAFNKCFSMHSENGYQNSTPTVPLLQMVPFLSPVATKLRKGDIGYQRVTLFSPRVPYYRQPVRGIVLVPFFSECIARFSKIYCTQISSVTIQELTMVLYPARDPLTIPWASTFLQSSEKGDFRQLRCSDSNVGDLSTDTGPGCVLDYRWNVMQGKLPEPQSHILQNFPFYNV